MLGTAIIEKKIRCKFHTAFSIYFTNGDNFFFASQSKVDTLTNYTNGAYILLEKFPNFS